MTTASVRPAQAGPGTLGQAGGNAVGRLLGLPPPTTGYSVARVGVPMMPVARGERETRRQIVLYSLLLYAVTQLPFCAGGFGGIYLGASMLLGLAFIAGAVRLYRRADRRAALRLYLFSLVYLALLFGAMVVDAKL